ncbi:MAG: hypothetical protein C0404_03280 [Verrucomicrobia bacterium]|nr:hypothetical protein [Verrucomicrobiota bacterium]
MIPYRRILCPVDFSKASEDSLKEGSLLAGTLNAKLVVLNVVMPVVPQPDLLVSAGLDMQAYHELLTREAMRKLDAMVAGIVPAEVKSEKVVLIGYPAQTIDKYSCEQKVDLIVIATHGMTNWRHYVMGSVAHKVIHHACTPVLVVRASNQGER